MNMQQQANNAMKYKTMLCKHYETPKGCVYKDKCQFAHGAHELKSTMNSMLNQTSPMMTGNEMGFSNNAKKLPNPANFKIVKCKNFERDGACKYGNTCTFAHGDTELRSKVENQIFSNPAGLNAPFMPMYNGFPMDPLYMGMPMTPDMAQMGMFPNMFGMNPNNINLNADPNQASNMSSMGSDMSAMAGNPFYAGMFPGMINPQQSNTNGQQNN